ncbi:DUF4912 domain-containing protein [bacterium CPR1]|nr:DUF4912 domain-containing protein [bacterium CPR1]
MEPAELPEGYGRDMLVLMPRDPLRCFAYWELAQTTSKQLAARHGETALARARLLLRVHRGGQPDLEFDISGPVRSWYFDADSPGGRLDGELCLRFEDEREESLVTSRPVFMPRKGQAGEDPAWPVKSDIYARVRRALGQEWPSAEG